MIDPVQTGKAAAREGRLREIDAEAVFVALIEEVPNLEAVLLLFVRPTNVEPLQRLVRAVREQRFLASTADDFYSCLGGIDDPKQLFAALPSNRARAAFALLSAFVNDRVPGAPAAEAQVVDPIEIGIQAANEGRMRDIDATAVFAALVDEALPIFNDHIFPDLPHPAFDPLVDLVRARTAGEAVDKARLRDFLLAISDDLPWLNRLLPSLTDRARAALTLLFAHLAELGRHPSWHAVSTPAEPAAAEPTAPLPKSMLSMPDFAMKFFSVLQFAAYWRGTPGFVGVLLLGMLPSLILCYLGSTVWAAASVTAMIFTAGTHIAPAIEQRRHARGNRPCAECRRVSEARQIEWGTNFPPFERDPACYLPDFHTMAIRGIASVTMVSFLWPGVLVAGLLPERVMMRVFVLTMKYAHARADAAKDTNGKSSP